MTSLFYLLPLYTIPFGYLFIPYGHFPLWLLACLPLLYNPFLKLRNKSISLFLLLIPVYSLFLSLVSSKYVPLGHLLALFTPFYLFTVYSYLIRSLTIHRVVNILANCFLIAIAILFVDILLRSQLLDTSYVAGFSGFGSDAFPLNRFAGSFTEPGHFGILLNFLQPFFLYTRVNRPYFIITAFAIPILVLATIGSAPSLICSLIFSTFYLLSPSSDRWLVSLSSIKSSLKRLRFSKLSFYLLLSSPIILLSLFTSARFVGFFSGLFTGYSTGDLLSAGNRAARVRYVLGEIWQNPLGSGIAPNWMINQFDGQVTLDRTTGEVFSSNVNSSISAPIDLAWFAGVPFLFISLLFIINILARVLFSISLSYDVNSRLLLSTGFILFITMIFRFTFVNNYYFPFLSFSLAFMTSLLDSTTGNYD